jgi:predicted Co/Zn/Cd cation transporter (cation efflux family)
MLHAYIREVFYHTPERKRYMEKSVFVTSIIGTTVVSALGLTFYFIAGSEAILLDGIFTLLGIPIAIVGLVVAKLSREAPTEDCPLGFGQTRPMLELFKSLFMLGLISVAAISAIETMMNGGRTIEGPMVVIYAAVAMASCFVFAGIIALFGGKSPSSLVKLERLQWVQDALLSGAIGLAFGIVTWVDHPAVGFIAPYLDQGLVIVLALVFIPHYLKTIASSGRQLLLSAPRRGTRERIRERVGAVLWAKDHRDFTIVMVSAGGTVLVDVQLQLDRNLMSHENAMNLRSEIEGALAEIEENAKVWLSFFPLMHADATG